MVWGAHAAENPSSMRPKKLFGMLNTDGTDLTDAMRGVVLSLIDNTEITESHAASFFMSTNIALAFL